MSPAPPSQPEYIAWVNRPSPHPLFPPSTRPRPNSGGRRCVHISPVARRTAAGAALMTWTVRVAVVSPPDRVFELVALAARHEPRAPTRRWMMSSIVSRPLVEGHRHGVGAGADRPLTRCSASRSTSTPKKCCLWTLRRRQAAVVAASARPIAVLRDGPLRGTWGRSPAGSL